MDVVARIKKQMDLLGWTEYRLAKEAGLPQTTVANLFRRSTLPSLPTLEAICKAFGMTMSSFFAERDCSAQEPMPDALWEALSPEQRLLCIELMRALAKKV